MTDESALYKNLKRRCQNLIWKKVPWLPLSTKGMQIIVFELHRSSHFL